MSLVPPGPCPICGSPPCTWGDDAWHRAVSRLIRIETQRGTGWQRLLAEERGKR